MTWMRGLWRRWSGAARRTRHERADLSALLSLDDRLLADIGLRRAEVAAAASGQLPRNQLALRGPIDPGTVRPLPSERTAAEGRPEPEPWDAAA